ncbi:MAG: efflux RND transporter periplasmic adaptor subunit [Verrucomicrobia bacterium]|nr:efflux RND transporter periplasmic adaptor subunit [Verrucomicrobiota bacterium]
MKTKSLWTLAAAGAAVALMAGLVSSCDRPGAPASALGAKARQVLYYQSAMHPWIKSDEPGRCTICGMELTPVYEGQAGFDVSSDVITLSPNSIRVLNVQTIEAKVQPLTKTLRVAGTIDDDDSRHRVLSAYVPGRIEKLHVSFVGAEVKAGEPLVEFYSPMLLQTERELRAVAGSTNSDLRAAVVSRLRQIGLTPEQIEAIPAKPADALTSQILAPISGTVTEKKIYAGQYVQEGEKLFEIADFATMWFQFRAYEQDLSWIRLGQKVDVSTPSLPGKVVAGVIKFIDPNLDEATRATKVRVELENPLVAGRRTFSHRLYADGVVHLEAPEVVAIPRSAIIQTGPQAVAFVDRGGGGYARRALQLGRHGDSLIEVLDGVAAGDQVVVNGNLLLDGQAEMNRSYASATEMPAATNPPTIGLPALTEAQQNAMREFLQLADAITASLAADNLEKFNLQAELTHDAAAKLFTAFAGSDAWLALAKEIEAASHLIQTHDLKEARREFYPFSTATVALAQAARQSKSNLPGLRVFRCPMAKDAFAGAPNRAEWIQLQPEIHNPWFGKEMLDCGSEVKP